MYARSSITGVTRRKTTLQTVDLYLQLGGILCALVQDVLPSLQD